MTAVDVYWNEDVLERLQARIWYGKVPVHDPMLGPCWEVDYTQNGKGYKVIVVNGRKVLIHRLLWCVFNGRNNTPPETELDHLCRNRGCPNPFHLEPVSARINALRSPLTIQSKNAGKTHCHKSHPLRW